MRSEFSHSEFDKYFLQKTQKILGIDAAKMEQLGAVNTFDIDDTDTKEEDCVLFLGLNPSGDEQDTLREKLSSRYFYYIDDKDIEHLFYKFKDKNKIHKWGFTYKKYYKPLFDLVKDTCGKPKWGWCNGDINDLISDLENIWEELSKSASEEYIQTNTKALKRYKKKLEEFYIKHKDEKTTVYIGDMFYYHDVKANSVTKLIENNLINNHSKGNRSKRSDKKSSDEALKKYCEEMLQKHISILRAHNKKIKFIYINNAFVSNSLCSDQDDTEDTKTYKKYIFEGEEIYVFFGGMLSNGVTDNYSKQRLIYEIREMLKKSERTDKEMTNIVICGASGHMGRVIADVISNRDDCKTIAGIDKVTAQYSDFPIYENVSELPEKPDVIIDFSHPSTLDGLLDYCRSNGTALVVATTGYNEEQTAKIKKAAEQIPLFFTFNMSLGVNLLADLARRATKILGDQFDIEIIEKHHNQKLDAPSGTAIMLADAINGELDNRCSYTYDRHSVRAKRGRNEIGMHSVRGGTIVGEHEIIFAGRDEVVSLKHEAHSKSVFAVGSVNAAIFLKDKPAGLYAMDDLLKED